MQTKEDLRVLFMEHTDKLHALLREKGNTAEYRCMHTSGTTNEPLPVVYTQRPDWNPVFLGEGERVVMTFGSKPLRLDFAQAYFDADTPSCDLLFLDMSKTSEVVADILEEFKPTTFVSPPTVLVRLTEFCSPEICEGVISIILAGELLGEALDEALRKRFPNAVVTNTYAATEAGELGVSCEQCQRNEFHPFDGTTFEIDNPDTEGAGDVLITKKNPGGVALQKYRIGDVGILKEHDGKQTIQLLGRRGFDYIKLSEALLIRDEFDRVAKELERYIVDYKAEVTAIDRSGTSVHSITLFIAIPPGNKEEIEEIVSREFSNRLFVTPNSTLSRAVEKGVFKPLVVKVVDRVLHETIKPQRLYMKSS